MARGQNSVASGNSLMFGTRNAKRLSQEDTDSLGREHAMLVFRKGDPKPLALHLQQSPNDLYLVVNEIELEKLQAKLGKLSPEFEASLEQSIRQHLVGFNNDTYDLGNLFADDPQKTLTHIIENPPHLASIWPSELVESLSLAEKLLEEPNRENIVVAAWSLQSHRFLPSSGSQADYEKYENLLTKLRTTLDEVHTAPKDYPDVKWLSGWEQDFDQDWTDYGWINKMISKAYWKQNLGLPTATFHKTTEFFETHSEDPTECFKEIRKKYGEGFYAEYQDFVLSELSTFSPREIVDALPSNHQKRFKKRIGYDFYGMSKSQARPILEEAMNNFFSEVRPGHDPDGLFTASLEIAWKRAS